MPGIGLSVSERRLVLGIVDLLLINGALLVAALLAVDYVHSLADAVASWKWYLTLTVVWLVMAFFFDCYNLARAGSTTASVRSAGPAVLATVGVYLLIPWLTPPLTSRGMIFILTALALGGVLAWRVAYARLFVQPWFRQRALVVGAGHAGRALAAALRTAPADANPFRGTGYEIVGFIDDDPARCDDCVEGVPILGNSAALVETAQALCVDEVILAITHRHAIADELFDALLRCRELGLRVVTMALVYERLTGRVPVDHVGRDLPRVLPMEENAGERVYQVVKRLIDLAAGVAGLVLMLVAALPIALANALTSPGPLLYKQRRVGQGGKVFEMYKFRSMRPDAENGTGAVWARAHDDRITPAGRVIRKTRIDEFPQAINLLRGEMSLVGPRPERPEFVEQLARLIPFYRARHAVKPGITGWAQIRYQYGNSDMDARVKLEYDLYYVKHAGLFLDLQIMLQTLPVMIQFKGT